MERDREGRDQRTYAIIGAAMKVHRQLGCGFLEPVYQEAMDIELGLRSIPYRREAYLPISYKGHRLTHRYRVDFVCFDRVLVDLKALDKLTTIHEAKMINYLKLSCEPIGLLLNFGTISLQFKRMVLSKTPHSTPG